MRRIALLVLPLLVVSAPLSAGPLDKGQVPADAKWVLHADLEGFLASKVGSAVLEEARKQGLDVALGAVQAMFGFDPTKDLMSEALFGAGFKESQAVVLIHAKVDHEKILAITKANPGFGESNYGEHVVYRWREKAKGSDDAGEVFSTFTVYVTEPPGSGNDTGSAVFVTLIDGAESVSVTVASS